MGDAIKNSLSRRDFIKTTASGVAAATTLLNGRPGIAAAGPIINPRVIGANDRVRLGIVGVKTMGGGHLRNLVGPEMVGDNQEVIAVCDVWETARQRAQATAKLSDAAVYSD